MSQGFAQARVFPAAAPLSPENPGRLSPARIGFLPGALPGRGGGGEADVPAAAHPQAALKKVVRETVPANAANLPSHLLHGLPFQRSETPPPGALSAEPLAAAPVAPPAVVGPAPMVAPPPLVVSPPGLVAPPAVVAASAMVSAEELAAAQPHHAFPSHEPSSPAQVLPAMPPHLGDAPLAQNGVAGPPVMQPAPPPIAGTAGASAGAAVPATATPAPVIAPPAMASPVMATPAMGSVAVVAPPALVGAIDVPPPVRSAPLAGPDPQLLKGATPEPTDAPPTGDVSPWMREASVVPAAPPAYMPEPAAPPVVAVKAPPKAPSGGGSKLPLIIGGVVLLVAAGIGVAFVTGVFKGSAKDEATQGPVKLDNRDSKSSAVAAPSTATVAPLDTPSAAPNAAQSASSSPVAAPRPSLPPTAPNTLPGPGFPRPPVTAKPPPTQPKFDPSGI